MVGNSIDNSVVPLPISIANGGTGAATAAAGFLTLGGITANQISAYSAGTAYALTSTPSAIAFGTTSPAITLNAAGTYLLLSRAKLAYNAATFIASRTSSVKLRRTNNTAADLTNGSVTAITSIITALTFTFIDQFWTTLYTTANTNDIISMFGSVDVVPSAGSLDVSEASIIAIRLQQ